MGKEDIFEMRRWYAWRGNTHTADKNKKRKQKKNHCGNELMKSKENRMQGSIKIGKYQGFSKSVLGHWNGVVIRKKGKVVRKALSSIQQKCISKGQK